MFTTMFKSKTAPSYKGLSGTDDSQDKESLLTSQIPRGLMLGVTARTCRCRQGCCTVSSPPFDLYLSEGCSFHFGFGKDKSEYQGEPADELDAKWKTLYHSMFHPSHSLLTFNHSTN